METYHIWGEHFLFLLLGSFHFFQHFLSGTIRANDIVSFLDMYIRVHRHHQTFGKKLLNNEMKAFILTNCISPKLSHSKTTPKRPHYASLFSFPKLDFEINVSLCLIVDFLRSDP